VASLSELNAHLFAQLDRLDVETLTPEQIEAEAKRAEAMVQIADRITENAKVQLTAARLFAEHGQGVVGYLPQIGKAASTKDQGDK
jgi:ribosomal protein L17